MSKDTNRHITRRNVLAGIGATGIGTAVGAYGVAAGENNSNGKGKDKGKAKGKDKGKNGYIQVPVAIDWQESFYDGKDWKKIDAFPDKDNDGKQDKREWIDYCEGEDALVNVEDPLSSELRTDNKYTDPGDPLINFHGLKPGSRGEVTLSYHLCYFPGKTWLKAPKVKAHKKFLHEAQARVWYDEYPQNNVMASNENDNFDGGYPGDNKYHEYEPIIAQGSLKHVMSKLEEGVQLSENPYMASQYDREGEQYYAYPQKKADDDNGYKPDDDNGYKPAWITDDNIKKYVKKPKIHKVQNLRGGAKLHLPGVGYWGDDNKFPDLDITIKKVIKNKKGKVVGFRWKSSLPICRIEVAGTDDTTKLNVYDRALSGTALAPRYHDHSDCDKHDDCDDCDDHKYGRRRPMTGFKFGVCGYHDEDDWCIENSNTGYIGFEWWLPKHAKLEKKTKFTANFDFKAKRCKKENGNGNGNGDGNGRQEISFVAFCVDEDDIESGDSFDDFDIMVTETNQDGEPVGIMWDSNGIPVQTVVLFGGGDWFNQDVSGDDDGMASMGQPGEGNQRTGQTQSAPCGFDDDYCSVKFNQGGGSFTPDDPQDNCFD